MFCLYRVGSKHISNLNHFGKKEELNPLNLFNIIKNDQKYWLGDQVKQDGAREEIYKEHFDHILKKWKEWNIGYLSLLMTEDYHGWLIASGLSQESKTVEYTRDVTNLPQDNSDLQ